MSELNGFRDGLDAHGADLGRWPERERARAEALLARSDEARAALREAEAFEHLLADAVPDAPTERIRRNVLAALPAPGVPAGAGSIAAIGGRRGPLGWLWAGGVSATVASMALSFYLGTANPAVWPTETAAAEDAAELSSDFDSMLFGIAFDGEAT
jgi:hypothetical protein